MNVYLIKWTWEDFRIKSEIQSSYAVSDTIINAIKDSPFDPEQIVSVEFLGKCESKNE